MSYDANQIAICDSCKGQMDITVLAPFTNVNCPSCGAQQRVKIDLAQYQLVRRQGHGGMSLVFAAKDKNLDREVAIKILNEQYSMDTIRINQFEQEAKITAGISHPNVVRVYTVGQAFDRYYIAMELISGESLENIMEEQGALTEEFLIPKVLQVAEGLSAAYTAGLIHRDMKPGNILIDNLDTAKIVDFGLALMTQGGVAMADEIWATPYYVPPETLAKQPEDFRSDIYALCATIYHALTGVPPFVTHTRSISELTELKKSLRPLKEVAPHISDCTCELIDRGMAYAPDDRFGSYEEMLQAIQYTEDHIGVEGVSLPGFKKKAPNKLLSKLKFFTPIILGLSVLGIGGYFVMKDTGDSGDTHSPAHPPVEFDGSEGVVKIDEKLKKNIEEGYADLHRAVTSNSYSTAAELAMKLYDLPKHPEPSKTLSGVHGIIASYLEGNLSHSKKSGLRVYKDALRMVTTRRTEDYKRQFIRCLYNIMKLGAIEGPEVRFKHDKQANALFWFVASLKNIEIGELAIARKQLEKFVDLDLTDTGKHADIFGFYQTISQDYLDDITQLEKINNRSIEQMKRLELIDLKETAENMSFKTNLRRGPWMVEIISKNCGRQIEVWEKFLTAKNVAGQKIAKKFKFETFLDAVSSLENQRSERDYLGMVERLKALGFRDHEESVKLKQYIYVCQCAGDYLKSYAASDEDAFVEHDVQSEEGEPLRIVKSSKGGLELDQGSSLSILGWNEVYPESLLGLHKTLTTGVSDEEKDRFAENAACYAIMNKLESIADSAAKKLGGRDEEFAHRWKQAMSVLRN